MIDFSEELKKYKPLLGMEDVEKSIHSEESTDIMDLLQYIKRQISTEKE